MMTSPSKPVTQEQIEKWAACRRPGRIHELSRVIVQLRKQLRAEDDAYVLCVENRGVLEKELNGYRRWGWLWPLVRRIGRR